MHHTYDKMETLLPPEIIEKIANNFASDIHSLLSLRQVNRKWRWLCSFYLQKPSLHVQNALRAKALKHCFQNIQVSMADHILTEEEAMFAAYANDQHFRDIKKEDLTYKLIMEDRLPLFNHFLPPTHMRAWRAREVLLADLLSERCRVPHWPDWKHTDVRPNEPFDVHEFLRSLNYVLLWEQPASDCNRWSVIEGCHRIVILKNHTHLFEDVLRNQVKVKVIIGSAQSKLDQFVWEEKKINQV
jgi:hypothetical protein